MTDDVGFFTYAKMDATLPLSLRVVLLKVVRHQVFIDFLEPDKHGRVRC